MSQEQRFMDGKAREEPSSMVHVLCCCEEGPLKLTLILPFTKVVVLLSVNWCSRGHVPALTCPADARQPCLSSAEELGNLIAPQRCSEEEQLSRPLQEQ